MVDVLLHSRVARVSVLRIKAYGIGLSIGANVHRICFGECRWIDDCVVDDDRPCPSAERKRLGLPLLVIFPKVITFGLAGSPTKSVPPALAWPVKPLEMVRPLSFAMLMGPDIVRLYVSPEALSMAKPKCIVTAFAMTRSPPVGRMC